MSRALSVVVIAVSISACADLVPLGDGSQFVDSDTGRADDEDTEDTFEVIFDTDDLVDDSGLDTAETDATDTSDTADTGDTSDTGDTGTGGGGPTAAGGTMLLVEVYEGDGSNKYVALFNASQQSVDLTGWNLVRYSNGAGAGGGYPITLIGSVASGAHHVVVKNHGSATSWFSSTFSQSAEQSDGGLDHNGDDAYELRNASGGLVDIYGEVGVDGTGEDWVGEDGVWTRNLGIVQGTSVWTASEWTWAADLDGGSPYTR